MLTNGIAVLSGAKVSEKKEPTTTERSGRASVSDIGNR